MNKFFFNYEHLIIKEFEGDLSPQEKSSLEHWLQSDENRTIYQQQIKLLESVAVLQKMQKINKQNALKRVESQLFNTFSLNFIKKLERVAAILFIPVLLAISFLYFNQNIETVQGIVYNTVEIPLGMRSSMELPDGTTVWLNAGSSLRYPATFDKNIRQVELNGEAYFEVTKNRQCPFIVSTSDLNIKVLGTSFDCKAYSTNNEILVALEEGEVEISGKKESSKFLMKPGYLATYSKVNKTLERKNINLEKYIAWKNGKLMFRDDSMTDVIEKLGHWYNVEFQVEDKEILSYVYSATFPGESLDQVLKMLSLSAPIDFRILSRKEFADKSYEKQVIKIFKRKEM